jgi:hypothetical protein
MRGAARSDRGDGLNPRLMGAAYWLSFALVCYSVPKLRAGELRRAAWAESLSFDGDTDGRGAVFVGAEDWNNRTIEFVIEQNGCDLLLDAVGDGGNGFARELRSRGFYRVRCNGASREIAKPFPRISPRRQDGEAWA